MGRRSKLTQEVHDAIVGAIQLGASARIAAASAGIGERTFHTWMRRRDGPYRQFRQDVQKARASHAIDALEIIHRAAETKWQAAAWLLERRHGYCRGAALGDDLEPVVDVPHPGEESTVEYLARQVTEAETATQEARARGSWQAVVAGQRQAVMLRAQLDAARAAEESDFAVDDAESVAAEIRALLDIPVIAEAFARGEPS